MYYHFELNMNIKQLLVILLLILYSCSDSDSFSSPESSWIEGASYNRQTEVLVIETDKQEYTFKGVPTDVWEGFKNASSKGNFYHQYIRDRYHL